MHKKLTVGIAVAAMLAPALLFAQTSTPQSQVETILGQIRALQAQLRTLLASSTPGMIKLKLDGEMMPPGQMGKMLCIELQRDLRVGSQGDDVKKLQELLAEDPEIGFRGKATGFFGPLTANAMAKFQMRHRIASSTDGRVGPATRGFLQRACGQGLGQGGGDDMNDRMKVAGEITATSATGFTMQVGGENRTVIVNASTTIHIMPSASSSPAIGSMNDLTVGKHVGVMGTTQSDGSITARMIQVGIPPHPMGPMKQMMRFKFDSRGKPMP